MKTKKIAGPPFKNRNDFDKYLHNQLEKRNSAKERKYNYLIKEFNDPKREFPVTTEYIEAKISEINDLLNPKIITSNGIVKAYKDINRSILIKRDAPIPYPPLNKLTSDPIVIGDTLAFREFKQFLINEKLKEEGGKMGNIRIPKIKYYNKPCLNESELIVFINHLKRNNFFNKDATDRCSSFNLI